MNQAQRRFAAGFFFAAVAPLVIASVAFACQKITPIHTDQTSGAAGTEVRVTGTNFDTNASSSNVEVRWDRRDGPSLASIPAASLADKGTFDVTVTVPADAAIGNHIFIATQTLANGQPCVGCPGRANFEVTAAAAQASSNSAAAAPASDNTASDEAASDYAAASPSATGDPAPAASQPAATSQPAASQPAAASQPSAASQPASPVQAQQPAPATASGQRPVAPATAQQPTVGPAAPASDAVSPVSPAAPAAAADVATPAPPAPAGVVESAPASAPAALVGGSSAAHSSRLPGLTLVGGLVLALLGFAAFWKTGRSVLGGDQAFVPAG